MENVTMDMAQTIAIISVCAIIILEAVLRKFKPDAEKKFKDYYAVAMRAFAWVETAVPDDYGTDKDDPKYEKMIHKADVFLKKFSEFSKASGLDEPNAAMLKEAEKLASYLANEKKKNA